MLVVINQPVMHDSDTGIGIDSGMSPIFAGIGIKNIGIREKYYSKLVDFPSMEVFLYTQS